jgi:hypothetical protein
MEGLMRIALRSGIVAWALAAAVLFACGKKEKAEPPAPAATGVATDTSTAPVATAPSAATPEAPAAAPGTPAPAAPEAPAADRAAPAADRAAPAAALAPADVDAYRRGQETELARVEKLLAELAAAKDDAEKEGIVAQLNNRAASEEQGAQAAKMDVVRYRAVSATVDDMIMRWRRSVFVSRMMQDTTRIATLPPEKQAQVRAALAAAKTPYAGLPQETIDAVAPRVAELDSLHVITGSLVNQAVRAAKAPAEGGSDDSGGH